MFYRKFITIAPSHCCLSQSHISKGSCLLDLFRRDMAITPSIVQLTRLSNGSYYIASLHRYFVLSLIPILHCLPLYVKPFPFPLSMRTPDVISQSLIASSPRYRYRSSLLHTYVKSSVPLPIADAILRSIIHHWICPRVIQRLAFNHSHFLQK